MTTSPLAAQIISRSHTVLLDFDGPICDIFSGLPNPYAANCLRALLSQRNVFLPARLRDTSDSFDILLAMPEIAPAETGLVEEELAAVERAAAALAEPTPHTADTVVALRAAGKRVGIVSNNALSAVQIYMAKHRLSQRIDGVAARTEPDPALLKPHPHLVNQVLRSMDIDPIGTVFIGDHTNDIEAAHAAGVAGIGYANKPGKLERLQAVGADAILTDMSQARALLTVPRVARTTDHPHDLSR
jgi:phosphoglycolate phosphatase